MIEQLSNDSTTNPPDDRQLLQWLLEQQKGSTKRTLAWQLFGPRYENYIWSVCSDLYASPSSNNKNRISKRRLKYKPAVVKLVTKVLLAIDDHPELLLKGIYRLKDPLVIENEIKAGIGRIIQAQYKRKEHLRYNYVEKRRKNMDELPYNEEWTPDSSFKAKKQESDPIDCFTDEDVKDFFVRLVSFNGLKLDPDEQMKLIAAFVPTLSKEEQKLYTLMAESYKGLNHKDEDGVVTACRKFKITSEVYYQRKSRLIKKLRSHLTKELLK
ncbi:MAG: hypothetical protein PF694_02885 [Bacteroidetes bacterium]|jgi:hypothetical protein|nr:hypothetical protein [Bacteroidota bacterium]